MKWFLPAASLTIIAAVLLARQRMATDAVDSVSDDAPDQLPDVLDEIKVTLTPSTYTAAAVPPDLAAQNEAAFLDMIAYAAMERGKALPVVTDFGEVTLVPWG